MVNVGMERSRANGEVHFMTMFTVDIVALESCVRKLCKEASENSSANKKNEDHGAKNPGQVTQARAHLANALRKLPKTMEPRIRANLPRPGPIWRTH